MSAANRYGVGDEALARVAEDDLLRGIDQKYVQRIDVQVDRMRGVECDVVVTDDGHARRGRPRPITPTAPTPVSKFAQLTDEERDRMLGTEKPLAARIAELEAKIAARG